MEISKYARVDITALENLVADLTRGLIKEGNESGNWDDARGTGDALIALFEVLAPEQFTELRRSAARFMEDAAQRESGSANWGEEVWDSSIAIIALCRAPKPDRELVREGASWLIEQYRRGETNWYSEPWESLWALVAMHDATLLLPELADDFDPKPVLAWLLSVFDSESRLLVNKHYTAQFLIASSRWIDHPVTISPDSKLAADLQETRLKAASSLKSCILQDGKLWAPDMWANALIVWGLCDSGAITADQVWVDKIHRWFRETLANGAPTEDRAFALLALARLARVAKSASTSALPEGLLAFEERNPDPTLRLLVEHVRNLQAEQDLSAQRFRLAPKLEGLPDFRHKPPFVSRTSVLGYYTVHLNQAAVNVFGILVLTTALTALSTTASEQLGERYAALATVIPIALGSLATLAQILDIRPREWFDRKDRKS